jgi:hypothetical protein
VSERSTATTRAVEAGPESVGQSVVCSAHRVLLGWATPTGLLTGAVLLGTGVALSTPAFFAAIFATADPSSRDASGTLEMAIEIQFEISHSRTRTHDATPDLANQEGDVRRSPRNRLLTLRGAG